MTSRERLTSALNHKPVDRLCVDFGAGGQIGMGVCAVHRLREAILGKSDHKVKVSEPYQMLGEIDEELRKALRLDVVGVHPPYNMFGFRDEGWKPFTMPVDGTEMWVPEKFNFFCSHLCEAGLCRRCHHRSRYYIHPAKRHAVRN